MYKKNIVRYMTVGEPVVIGSRPKEEKPAEKPEEELEAKKAKEEPEPEPEPKNAIPQEVLDKVFAEIEEIERKEKLTEKTLLEAQEIKSQAEEIKTQAQELEKQAQETLNAANKESEKIVEDTRKDAEKLLEKVQKDGYDKGYKEGKEKGINDGKKKIEKDLANVVKEANEKAQKTIQDAKEQTSEYFIRAEDDIAKVVMMAIEKILPQHFLDMPQVILPIVREAINHVRDQKEIKVHVEPYSYDLILMARSEFQSMLSDGNAIIEIVSDDALKPGDCVIETPNGGVDARLSTQIGLMKNAIKSVLNN